MGEQSDVSIQNSLVNSYQRLYPILEQQLQNKENNELQKAFDCWIGQKQNPPNDPKNVFAKQYGYLLLVRSISCQTINEKYNTEISFEKEIQKGGFDQAFANYSKNHDFLKANTEAFRSCPLPKIVDEELLQFIEEISGQTSSILSDVSNVYEQIIPISERERFGQYYTPSWIADVLSDWAVQTPIDSVLDPCSGSGIITDACFSELMKNDRKADVQIDGFDIDPFAVELSNICIGMKYFAEGKVETCTDVVEHTDFFEATLKSYDASIANPPYIRHENLPREKEHYRGHLDSFDGYRRDYRNGDNAISSRADLYCYFLTRVTEVLEQGGRLAWIVPTKWLLSEYGDSVRRFIYNHYSVRGVVHFQTDLFDSALVDTVLIFFERDSSLTNRQETVTNFVTVYDDVGKQDVLDYISHAPEVEEGEMKISDTDERRIVSVKQETLMRSPSRPISHLVMSPVEYAVLEEHQSTVPLSEYVNLEYGTKTGANELFVVSAEEVESFGIESDCLSPTVTSIREVDGREVSDTDEWLFHVPESYTQYSVEKTSERLRENGLEGATTYLNWMAEQSASENDSVQNTTPWFSLPESSPAPLLIPLAMDTRLVVLRDSLETVPVNRFALVFPDGEDAAVLGALLNSSIAHLALESRGRVTGGGAVNYAVSDLRELPIPDPSQFSESDKEQLTNLCERFYNGESVREDIDSIVLQEMDVPFERSDVVDAVKRLQELRREDSQVTPANTNIETVVELSRKDDQTQLDEFV